METSRGNELDVVETLTKIVEAFDATGIKLIGDEQLSQGSGRGVRLKEST